MAERTLQFANPKQLSQLYCGNPANLAEVENRLGVHITSREDWLKIEGSDSDTNSAATLFELLGLARDQGLAIRQNDFEHNLAAVERGEGTELLKVYADPIVYRFKRRSIVPKTVNQKRYVQFIEKFDIVFGVGPAGTGKTYLAMAAALNALMQQRVAKIIITRPAVEAGEALGFLPGDLTEKILPYLRPIYDAMYDMLGKEDTARMMEKGLIEIAPLAYMRGRTLSEAYIILDEAQNTTPEQMMMFLTRLGESSKMIITGDITQVDLPKAKISGLKQAIQVLHPVAGIKLFYFDHVDVVRHPLVSRIIQAYEHYLADSQSRSTR